MAGLIDLNADLGEDDSPDGMARDAEILSVVSSCSIACGGHAGDEATMVATLAAAKANGVVAGAHPSYPDRKNFGRVSMAMSAQELRVSLTEQVELLSTLAKRDGVTLGHLKPHGALYNDAQDDAGLAAAIAEVAAEYDLPLVGMAGSACAAAAAERGMPYLAEGFVDRRYTPARRLQSRGLPGAVIEEEAQRVEQAVALAKASPITASDGSAITVSAQTLCLHSDSEGALATARAVRAALEMAGLRIGRVQ